MFRIFLWFPFSLRLIWSAWTLIHIFFSLNLFYVSPVSSSEVWAFGNQPFTPRWETYWDFLLSHVFRSSCNGYCSTYWLVTTYVPDPSQCAIRMICIRVDHVCGTYVVHNVPYVWYTYVLTMYVVHSVYVCRCWGPTLCWAILRTKVTSLSTSLIWTQLNFSAHLTASKLAQSSALLHIRPSSFFSAPYNICSFQDSTEYWALLVGEVRGEISNPSDIELEGTEDTREIGHLQDYECCSMCHRGYLSFNDINPM